MHAVPQKEKSEVCVSMWISEQLIWTKASIYYSLQTVSTRTNPSGCNFTRNFLRLKQSFRILAQEKALILV